MQDRKLLYMAVLRLTSTRCFVELKAEDLQHLQQHNIPHEQQAIDRFVIDSTAGRSSRQTMPVHTKAQVLALLHKHQQELRRFGVNCCGVFGSFVRDAAHEHSDVDILVAFEPNQKTFDNFVHLTFFLEDLFGSTVDLIAIESLSPYIGPHILREVEYVSIGT